jgi:hypothetical protein
VIRKGWGIFPTKNAFLLFDITFYFDGAGKESLLQVASFSMASLGLFLLLFLFPSGCGCCLLFPSYHHQNCLLYFSCREGKTKRKKGDHKTSFGHWEGFQQIRKKGLQHFLFPLFFLFFSLWGPRLFYLRPRRPLGDFLLLFQLALAALDWLG